MAPLYRAPLPPGPARRLIARLAHACGFEIVPASREPLEHELLWARNFQRLGGPGQHRLQALTHPVESVHLRWLLDLYRPLTVIDVGANRGQFARRILDAGWSGDLHCFEPQPELQAGLQIAASPRARLHPHALGQRAEHLEITRYADDSFSSFHPASAQGRTSFPAEFQPVDRFPVEVRRLDAIWPALGSPDPQRCLLKTDTQGHDLAVLQGAGNLLDRIPLVVTKCPIVPLYENAAGFQELANLLNARGLRLSGTYPVSFDPSTGALLELNAWFVRHPLPR